jgi:hypothetical protein
MFRLVINSTIQSKQTLALFLGIWSKYTMHAVSLTIFLIKKKGMKIFPHNFTFLSLVRLSSVLWNRTTISFYFYFKSNENILCCHIAQLFVSVFWNCDRSLDVSVKLMYTECMPIKLFNYLGCLVYASIVSFFPPYMWHKWLLFADLPDLEKARGK